MMGLYLQGGPQRSGFWSNVDKLLHNCDPYCWDGLLKMSPPMIYKNLWDLALIHFYNLLSFGSLRATRTFWTHFWSILIHLNIVSFLRTHLAVTSLGKSFSPLEDNLLGDKNLHCKWQFRHSVIRTICLNAQWFLRVDYKLFQSKDQVFLVLLLYLQHLPQCLATVGN